jgi:hypothetical protein
VRVNSPANPGYSLPDEFAQQVGQALKSMIDGTCLSFTCDGKPRVVEVHAIGLSSKDNGLVIRAFQVAGGASRPLPAWSLFRVDRMSDVVVTPRAHEGPRDGYRQGDSQMAPVLFELEI